MLANDGVRLQLARVLPEKVRSSQLRLMSPVMAAALAPLPASSAGLRALVVLTLDGQVQWFRYPGSMQVSLESMGRVAGGAAAIDLGFDTRGAVLAVGHKGGNASIWRVVQDDGPRWQRLAALRVAHHEWEDVDRVATSRDGRLLLACTGDNVALWWLGSDEGDQVLELHSLHGGASQLSAAAVGGPGRHGYAVAVAFQAGGVEGWAVEGEPPEFDADLWQLPPSQTGQRLVALAVEGADAGAVVVGAGADGRAWLWRVADGGRGLHGPLWEVQPSPQGLPISGLSLLTEPSRGSGQASCWVAMGFGSHVAVLDCETGKEDHRSMQPGGSVIALG